MANNHKDALEQLADRFKKTMEQQEGRNFIVGAVSCDCQIEFVHMDNNYAFHRSGLLQINLADKNSLGLDMLVRLVTASKAENGYISPDDVNHLIISSGINFKFETLIRKRSSHRGSFVVAGTVDDGRAIIKTSVNDNECQILTELDRLY